jgi:hypothetical protein
MNIMIHSFYDGTGTAWVPLNRRMCDLLEVLTSEDRFAGVGTFLLLMKGVDMASDEYSDVVMEAQIENSVQSARREQEARVEIEKLHLTLEVSKERVESATVVAGGEKSEDDQLSTALGIEDNGVNEGSSAN